MKTTTKYITLFALPFFLMAGSVFAQQSRDLQYYRSPDKTGINVFETPKTTDVEFDGITARLGGDFALQFQGLSQSNANGVPALAELSNNFNLPSANLNLDVQLERGLRMHLRTYLSSRHHAESYVKGGYMQIDRLDFIREDFMAGLMESVTLRVGMDQINYGDAHFRRSDNAAAIYNPFVGNYLMDNFTTEPFFEVTVQNSGFLGVLGASNGRLNQSPTPGDDGMVLFGKLGYDKQLNDDLRFRLTGSFYNSSEESTRDYIYGGDRAGARYYLVMNTQTEVDTRSTNDFGGRFNPGFASHTAFQINPFVKFQGLEFFGIFETTSNNADIGGSFTQLGAELLYRFGANEDLYIGGRYNQVSGEQFDNAATREISRINFGGGWFMTNNVLTKLEYVSQNYDGDGWNGTPQQGAEFSGIMLEAVISF